MCAWKFRFSLVLLFLLIIPVAGAQTVFKTLTAERPGYYKVTIRYPQFAATAPLSRYANRVLADWSQKNRDEFVRRAQSELKNEKPIGSYTLSVEAKVTYFYAPRLISVFFDLYQYTGGAHGMATYLPFNFGMKNRQPARLNLSDLFRKGSDYQTQVSGLVLNRLLETGRASYVEDGTMTMLDKTQFDRFAILPDGLLYLLGHYEAGPYAVGRFEIKLSVGELGPDFNRALILARGQ